jgi:hypothetical protein
MFAVPASYRNGLRMENKIKGSYRAIKFLLLMRRPDVLVQVRPRLESFRALGTPVGPVVAVPVPSVLGKVSAIAKHFRTRVTLKSATF